MKNFTLLLLCFLLFTNYKLQAQWQLGGNDLSEDRRFGSNNNFSVLFETNNLERGRLTNTGLWGIGATAPNAKLHINSTSTQDPFRVQVNGATKLFVHRGGGLAIGTGSTPPANGLLVSGSVGIGTTNPGSYYKLNVINSAYAGGIYSSGGVYGLVAKGGQTGISAEGGNEGIYAYSLDGYGVNGRSNNGNGGYFLSVNGPGLVATTFNGTYAATFYGNTYASGTYYGSDKNIKKNIQEVGNALSIINQLKPKHYEFREDGKYAALHLPKGNHYGLLAQDVEQILPNLVKETPHELHQGKDLKSAVDGNSDRRVEPLESMNIKAVNYTELIPIMIKAIQELEQSKKEQQATLEQQQQTIGTLLNEITRLKSTGGVQINSNLVRSEQSGVTLDQNHPNPTNNTTTFRYSIPTGSNAQILVYEATSGKLVKTLPAPGTGQRQMDCSNLPAGNYIYTLIVDGKQAAARQLVISK